MSFSGFAVFPLELLYFHLSVRRSKSLPIEAPSKPDTSGKHLWPEFGGTG